MRKSVFVLKPSSFGDIIHTLPAVAWIKEIQPEWKVSWLINTEWAPLLADNPTVDQVTLFTRRRFRGITGAFHFWKWIRAEVSSKRPDLALDFQGLLRTALIARFSRAGASYGLSDAREGATWFYQRTADVSRGTMHSVERYLVLAGLALGIEREERLSLRFPLPAGIAPAGTEAFLDSPYILLHPFSRGHGKSLGWEQIVGLCKRLAPKHRVILVGRMEEEEPDLPAGCVSYLDHTTIEELIWLIRRAAFVISVDSGPMHLAAALNRPLLSIHAWSDPRKVGPYRADAWVWKNGRLFRFDRRHDMERDFYRPQAFTLQAGDLDKIASLAAQSLADPA